MGRVTGTAALAAMAALAGCGGGSGAAGTPVATSPATDADSYAALYASYHQDLAGLSGYSNSAFTAMPKTGTAAFAGYADVEYNTGDPQKPYAQPIGHATLTADFARASVSGSASDFMKGYLA